MKKIPNRFSDLFNNFRKYKVPYKISFIIIGIISTLWFLIRVIPKPSRAAYPCMKTAAPIMSSFIIYLLSLSGSVILFKNSKTLFSKANYLKSAGVFFLASIALFIGIGIQKIDVTAQINITSNQLISNMPFGEGVGVFPGRVVWAWDPNATDENCTNLMNDTERGEDGYFLAKNNNQSVIDKMLNETVRKLSGKNSIKLAWNALFNCFNTKKGLSTTNYIDGQKIFIKINQGGGGWLTTKDSLAFNEASWATQYYGIAETSPAIVISLLKQLVDEYGISQENIYVGDPIAHIYKHNYDQMVAVFPNVHYVDKSHSDLGRTLLTISDNPSIFYSDKGDEMPGAISDKLYAEMENADYLINIAALKAHARGGVTLTAKNHFGSHTRNSAENLHNGLIAPENDQPIRTKYGMYRVLTDIMGHEKLGGNTLLFIVDGLWGGTEAIEKPVKWKTTPFNNDWPNSIFASQDQVALESVCLDFLRSEFTDVNEPGRARPFFKAVNDYLLQAADSSFWPDDIIYDPENDGTPIGSLGTHEHWNNDSEKLYSRNLGLNNGIELISTNGGLVKTGVSSIQENQTPVIDGEANDTCWLNAVEYKINYAWINWGVPVDSSDFYGTYKTCWSQETNLLYFYVEITDDVFIDNYSYPEDNYPDFDVLEIFIDEDKSEGLHVFDDNTEWGLNSENAFSYHLMVNSPIDGGTVSDVIACDIDGTNWGNKEIVNYASHFPDLTMKKEGNIYKWEFSMKVFNDTYDNSNPESSRVVLDEDKVMGVSLAYCDNDQPDGERDNFFGSVWVDESAYNNHWKLADDFGLLRLVGENSNINHEVIKLDTIPNMSIKHGEGIKLIDNLNDYFADLDGDIIAFTATSDNSFLILNIVDSKLTVTTNTTDSINATIIVTASDGEFTKTDEFNLIVMPTGIFTYPSLTVDVKTYPNPFINSLNISFSDVAYIGQVYVMLHDLQGKVILQKSYFKSKNDFTEELIINNIKKGNYILRIYYSDKISNQLITKY